MNTLSASRSVSLPLHGRAIAAFAFEARGMMRQLTERIASVQQLLLREQTQRSEVRQRCPCICGRYKPACQKSASAYLDRLPGRSGDKILRQSYCETAAGLEGRSPMCELLHIPGVRVIADGACIGSEFQVPPPRASQTT